MISGTDLFFGLFNNLAIFIVLVSLYGVLNGRFEKTTVFRRQAVLGLFFGLFAIACMHVKIPVAEGVIVDQRNTIVALSGTFGGPLSALFCAAMAGAYRIYLGGSGAFGGVVGVSLSAVAGIGAYRLRQRIDTVFKAAVSALVATLIILPGFLFIDDIHAGWRLLKAMALPYGGAVCLGLFFLGLLLSHEENRHKAEAALKKSEIRYRRLFENLVDVSYQTDEEGNLTVISPSSEKIFGYRPEEVLGRKIVDFYRHSSRRDDFVSQIRRDGHVQNFEAEIRKKDGSFVWAATNAKLLMSDDGSVVGTEGVARDISQLKQSEEEKQRLETSLLQAQKMESVGRLAGGVAHDYNNALSVIIGGAELAMESMDRKGDAYRNLETVLTAANRAANITRQLLAFARKQTIVPRVIDLNESVESLLKMLRRLIGEDIDLAWLPKPVTWPVRVDPSQIDQILVNLCVNARDAIEKGGKITIETRNTTFDEFYCADHPGFIPGDFVQLVVSDNGCGMDKETLANIYEPFFTTKGADKGTGLGMATVYGIVKQNKGFINVYSEPGRGTTIKISLPRHEGETLSEKECRAIEIPKARQETVLLVEDDVSILGLSGKILENLGYTVLGASSPGEAMRLCREHTGTVHLIVTDVIMPEMNGRELVEQLQPLYPDAKSLFISGYTANVIAHHGVLDEGVQFLQKPFSKMDLAVSVRKALDT